MAKKKQRHHHDPTLYICTIDTFITFSFDSLNVVNSTRITVCVNGAARLKRKPRGIWFIYKAIAFMYKKPIHCRYCKSLPFKGNEINSLFNAPQDLLTHTLNHLCLRNCVLLLLNILSQ